MCIENSNKINPHLYFLYQYVLKNKDKLKCMHHKRNIIRYISHTYFIFIISIFIISIFIISKEVITLVLTNLFFFNS